jgi:hypothetical protein
MSLAVGGTLGFGGLSQPDSAGIPAPHLRLSLRCVVVFFFFSLLSCPVHRRREPLPAYHTKCRRSHPDPHLVRLITAPVTPTRTHSAVHRLPTRTP